MSFDQEANVFQDYDLKMAICHSPRGTLAFLDESCYSQHHPHTPRTNWGGRQEITHPLVPYPHIPVMTGGEAISIFFIPFDL